MCDADAAKLHVAESSVGSSGKERCNKLAQRTYEGAGELHTRDMFGTRHGKAQGEVGRHCKKKMLEHRPAGQHIYTKSNNDMTS